VPRAQPCRTARTVAAPPHTVSRMCQPSRRRWTLYINLGPGKWACKQATWPKLLRWCVLGTLMSCSSCWREACSDMRRAPAASPSTPRRALWWDHCAGYFPTQLIKTADLDPDGRYIFVVAPHGANAATPMCAPLMERASDGSASQHAHCCHAVCVAARPSRRRHARAHLTLAAGIVTMFCWPCFDTDATGFSSKFPGA
jgi:hypothetical protein